MEATVVMAVMAETYTLVILSAQQYLHILHLHHAVALEDLPVQGKWRIRWIRRHWQSSGSNGRLGIVVSWRSGNDGYDGHMSIMNKYEE
jgi:hypothetical protein